MRGCEKIHHNDRGNIPAVIAAAPKATCSALLGSISSLDPEKEKKNRTRANQEKRSGDQCRERGLPRREAAEAEGGAVES